MHLQKDLDHQCDAHNLQRYYNEHQQLRSQNTNNALGDFEDGSGPHGTNDCVDDGTERHPGSRLVSPMQDIEQHYQLELARLALDDPPDDFDDEICDDDWPPFQHRMEANPGLPLEPISDSGDDGLGEEDLDIMDDPVFINNSDVYECEDVLEHQQAVQDLDTSPEAFNEALEIRNAYISLQRILLHLGKCDLMQHWRHEGDEVGAAPPISEEVHNTLHPSHDLLHDVTDGWGWFHVTSWGHMHSAGAIYIVICNLPRGIRFLWEEMILLTTVPGPREPSLEQLNKVIEPFVREMFLLEQGLPFKVHSFQHEQIIHAKLWFNASDLPASRKSVGDASHSKPGHFCSFCDKDSSCLSDASGFDPDSMGVVMEIVGSMAHDPFLAFVHRDESKQTQYAFFSHWATTASACERLFNKNGKQFSALDALPQWGYSCSLWILCILPSLRHMASFEMGLHMPHGFMLLSTTIRFNILETWMSQLLMISRFWHYFRVISREGLMGNETGEPLYHLALSFLFPDHRAPILPWSKWDSELGTGTWAYEHFAPLEAVNISQFSSTFILAPLPLQSHGSVTLFWITIAYDHVSIRGVKNQVRKYGVKGKSIIRSNPCIMDSLRVLINIFTIPILISICKCPTLIRATRIIHWITMITYPRLQNSVGINFMGGVQLPSQNQETSWQCGNLVLRNEE
ncbi:hypothetical protein BS47DRAFT_1365018 [Hydnum rufescens UP504]|uniref:Uncharacterized protein n=1 Tax=Hydnum rufescens UP504 TaxID=1448309 RepID=A0A9P6DTR0_9AGAM|nr:hypothetical protein BS47DRAFT_1365018 [Hydnum rufescens UP504]